uniref:6,7-dimethyl-8-ribityllumazine synthase n=1 Tax=Peronospora matthiolae TaxID=2874970 RepID=A0AAV1TLL5_9STRA
MCSSIRLWHFIPGQGREKEGEKRALRRFYRLPYPSFPSNQLAHGYQAARTGRSQQPQDGRQGLRVAIVRTQWNAEIVNSLVLAAQTELRSAGVALDDVVIVAVSGAYELPYAASRLITSQKLDAVICVGCLIKGETMHFEYICDAVSQGIMRVQLDTNVPVLFGVLTVLNEEQARDRAGLSDKGHNHGIEWAQTAVEMARLREATAQERLSDARSRTFAVRQLKQLSVLFSLDVAARRYSWCNWSCHCSRLEEAHVNDITAGGGRRNGRDGRVM